MGRFLLFIFSSCETETFFEIASSASVLFMSSYAHGLDYSLISAKRTLRQGILFISVTHYLLMLNLNSVSTEGLIVARILPGTESHRDTAAHQPHVSISRDPEVFPGAGLVLAVPLVIRGVAEADYLVLFNSLQSSTLWSSLFLSNSL